MIRKKFVNREKEMKFLGERLRKKGLEFVIISGRRRVGKSRLIEEFVRNKKVIYLLSENKPFSYNLKKFSLKISEFFKLPKVEMKSLKECLELIVSLHKFRKKLVVVIDEFSYLIKQNPKCVAEMQSIVDEILKDKNIFLILSGSAISLMQKHLLSYSSPLYGRITGTIILKPLSFSFLARWFPSAKFEDLVKIYGVTCGIPRYLEFFEGKNVESEIRNNFFDPNSFLFREMPQLLSEELRNVSTYFTILEAISKGRNKVTEMANYAYMDAKEMVSYLNILENLGFVRKITPLFGKKGIHEVSDNYARFWFRFISPYFSEIENYHPENAISEFEKEFNSYLGKVFEEIVLQLILECKIKLEFTKIGKWWHKDKEIDIVGLNEKTKEILFCECKWKAGANAEKICKELGEKAQYVQWNNEKRKESFAIFAKSFIKKIKEFEGRKVYCFDLKDLERLL